MKRAKLWQRFLAGMLSVSMVLSGTGIPSYASEAEVVLVPEAAETIDVDMSVDDSAELPAAETLSEDGADSEILEELPAADAGTVSDDTAGGFPEGDLVIEAISEMPQEETEPEAYEDLQLDIPTEVELAEAGGVKWFRFVPESSGTYRLASEKEAGLHVCLYDDMEGEKLAEVPDPEEELTEKESAEEPETFTMDAVLDAGEDYYFAVALRDETRTETFEVLFSRLEDAEPETDGQDEQTEPVSEEPVMPEETEGLTAPETEETVSTEMNVIDVSVAEEETETSGQETTDTLPEETEEDPELSGEPEVIMALEDEIMPVAEESESETETESETESETETENAGDEAYTVLTEDEPVGVRIETQGEEKWFSFTPDTSGLYRFASTGDYDTIADIYTDMEGESLKENDDISDTDSNFGLEYALEAGTTYYFRARMCYEYMTGYFEVSVTYVSRAVVSVKEISPMRTTYYSGLHKDSEVSAHGLIWEVTYSDGETERVYGQNRKNSSYGDVILKENVKRKYQYSGSDLVPGTYQATLSYLNREESRTIEVLDASEIPGLENLTADGEYRNADFYSFTVPSSGYYAYSLCWTEGVEDYSSYEEFSGMIIDADGNSLSRYIYRSSYSGDTDVWGYVYYLKEGARYTAAVGLEYLNDSPGYIPEWYGRSYRISVDPVEEVSDSAVSGKVLLRNFVPEKDVSYSLKVSGEDYYTDTYLYDADWNSVAINSYRSDGVLREYITDTLTAGETYYVVAFPRYRDTNLTLSVQEFNGTKLETGNPVSGTLSAEVSRYEFAPAQDGLYHIGIQINSPEYYYSSPSLYLMEEGMSIDYNKLIDQDDHTADNSYQCDWVYRLTGGEIYQLVLYSNYSENLGFEMTVDYLSEITDMQVTVLPTKTEYSRNETVIFTGLQAEITYADGTKESLTVPEYGSIEYSDRSGMPLSYYSTMLDEAGEQEVTVSYLDASATFKVKVTGESGDEIAGYTELTQGVEENISDDYGTRYQCRFTPEEDGFYEFSSTRGSTSYSQSWNVFEDWKKIQYYGGSYQRPKYLYLQAGHTYVFETSYYSGGDYTVKIDKMDVTILEEGVGSQETSSSSEVFFGFIPSEDGLYDFVLDRYDYSYYSSTLEVYGRNGGLSGVSSKYEISSVYSEEERVYLHGGEAYLIQAQNISDYMMAVKSADDTVLTDGYKSDRSGGSHWFQFVPEETAVYNFGFSRPAATYLSRYGYLYRLDGENLEQVTYVYGSSDLLLSDKLEQGVTYYYNVRIDETNSCTVSFSKPAQVNEMSIVSSPRTTYYALPGESVDTSELQVNVTYADGSEETLGTSYASEITGCRLNWNDNIQYKYKRNSTVMVPGTYQAEITYMDAEPLTFEIVVKAAAGSETELVLDQADTGSWDGSENLLWSFTPQEDGYYILSSSQSGSWMSLMVTTSSRIVDDLGVASDESGGEQPVFEEYAAYYLAKGTKYEILSRSAGVQDAGTMYDYTVKVTRPTVHSNALELAGTSEAFGEYFVEFDVTAAGLYSFEVQDDDDSIELYFCDRSGRLDREKWSSENNESYTIDGDYYYVSRYFANLEPGKYLIVVDKSYWDGTEYSVTSGKPESWSIEDVLSVQQSDQPLCPGYVFTAPSTGRYSFTFTTDRYASNMPTIYGLGNLYNSVGSFSYYDYETEKGEDGSNIYIRRLSLDLTEGEKYLLFWRGQAAGSSYTISAQNFPGVSSMEFVNAPKLLYYYKADQLKVDTDLGMDTSLKVVYKDGKEETIYYSSYGGSSSYTGGNYSFSLPDDVRYNSAGYVMPGEYQAVLKYMDLEKQVTVSVKNVSEMPQLKLGVDGRGTYIGETENADGSGYVRFTGTADGFYNLALSVDAPDEIELNKIVNSAYGNMDMNPDYQETDSKYLVSTSIYVKEGQSCYVNYQKIGDGSSGDSSLSDRNFTLSVELDASRSVKELALNEMQEVDIATEDAEQWFSFTPDESGTYIMNTRETPGSHGISLYESPDDSTALISYSDRGNGYDRRLSHYLYAYRTYYYKLETYYTGTYQAVIVKEAQRATNLELITEGEIYCSTIADYMNNSFADLRFRATYDDGTTEEIVFGYHSSNVKYYSLQGETMSYLPPEWEYDADGQIKDEQSYDVTFLYDQARCKATVTARSITAMETLEGEFTENLLAGQYKYYNFTPETGGYYRFDASAAEATPQVEMFDPYMRIMSSEYEDTDSTDGSMHNIKIYKLESGNSYCLRLGNMAHSAADITCSNAKISPVTSIEISSYPQMSYILDLDKEYSTEGLSITVTYEDGNSETIEDGRTGTATHLPFSTWISEEDKDNHYLGTVGTKTVFVSYMDMTTSYEIEVEDSSGIEAAPCSGTLASARDHAYVKFTAPESGYYRFSMTTEEAGKTGVIESVSNSSFAVMDVTNGNNAGQKIAFLMAGMTYYMKGRLESDGVPASGDYSAAVEKVADLKDGVQTDNFSQGLGIYQYTVAEDGYYQFTLDAPTDAALKIYNSNSTALRPAVGTKNDRKYYVVKLDAGAVYLITCSGSAEETYSVNAAKKPEVASIAITHEPDRVEYYAQFETSVSAEGLEIEITYQDGTKELLKAGERSTWGVQLTVDDSVIPKDAAGHYEPGTYSLDCVYLDLKASYEIEVKQFDVETAEQIELEKAVDVEIPANASVFRVFTPQKTVAYRFYSRGTDAVRASLYDSKGQLLRTNGDGGNFSIEETLTEGETYIFRVRAYSSKAAATTTIRLHDTTAFTEVTGVSLKEPHVTINTIGGTSTLTAEVEPADAQDRSVTWSSSSGAVTVEPGDDLTATVTAVSEGTSTVTVTTTDGGYTASCTVAVDLSAPEITNVLPADGSEIGPGSSILVYAHDDSDVDKVFVEHKKADATDYAEADQFTISDMDENYEPDAVLLINADKTVESDADALITNYADGDEITVRLTAIDKGQNRSEPKECNYKIDKKAPVISGLTGKRNEDTLAIDLEWTGAKESDVSHYAVYRKDSGADDSTYQYLGTVQGYVNKDTYEYSDATASKDAVSYVYKIVTYDKRGNNSDTAGESYTLDVTAEKGNFAPEIVLSCAATMLAGEKYEFDLSQSKDQDGQITNVTIDFGDESTSESWDSSAGTWEELAPFTHTYTLQEGAADASYTVTVTATDNEGKTSTQTSTVHVVQEGETGFLSVQVVDTDGIPVPGIPVYFNLGGEDQEVVNTDRTGRTPDFIGTAGFHRVGVYGGGYLPQTTSVELTVGDTAELTFTVEEKSIVEGKMESHRLTLSEIEQVAEEAKASGVDFDLSAPENHHVMQYNVQLEYATLNAYVFDNENVWIESGNGGGGYYVVPVSDNIIIVLNIPVGVSILKEFYDVDLYIINNSPEDLSLTDNHIRLNVPDGLTVMETAETRSADVEIDEIPGQTTKQITWVVRGDKTGTYKLSADYSGILSDFNVPVTGHFEDEEGFEVYGVENLEVTMKIPDSFTNGEFYYSLTMKNTAPAPAATETDMYLPGLNGEGELIQTMLTTAEGADPQYMTEMPDVLRAGQSIERFYRITDQIYEQLKNYPNYEDFVFYFRSMKVKELASNGVHLDVQVVPASELASVYEESRALPASLTVEASEVSYGYAEGEAKLTAAAAAPDNAEYQPLVYEWYDDHFEKIEGADSAELTVPAGLEAGQYTYYCVVITERSDNHHKARTNYTDDNETGRVVLTVAPRTAELVWSGDTDLVYSGQPVQVTAAVGNLVEGDTCDVTVEGGEETEAGSHTATATALSNENYQLPDPATHEYEIAAKLVTLTWAGFETRTYDGTASNVTAGVAQTDLIGEDTCSVTVTGGTETHAGSYTATAASLSNTNYELPAEATQAYTISKAPLKAAYVDEEIYYGTKPALNVNVTGFVNGETEETAKNYKAPEIAGEIPTAEGEHKLTPSGGSADDYEFPADACIEGTLTITRRDAAEGADGQYVVSAPDGSNGWYGSAGTVTANTGFALGTDESSIAEEKLTFGEADTAEGSYSFYVKNTATGEIFNESTLSYKKDAGLPEIGTPTAAPDQKGRQTVTFAVSDAVSGVDEASVSVSKSASGDAAAETVAAEKSGTEGTWQFTTTGAGTYTIRVKDNAGSETSAAVTVYALKFDSQGGSTCEDADIISGAEYGTLPQPTRAGYEFAGWKDADGNSVTEANTAGEADVTVRAEWTLIPAAAPEVSVGQPAVSSVYGTSAALEVTAVADSGTEYTLAYQWYEIAADGTETAVQDAQAAVWQTPAKLPAGTYTYLCKVTATRTDNGDTSPETVSDQITLTVGKKPVKLAWSGTQEREYDGNASQVSAVVDGLAEGDTWTVSVNGGDAVNAGTYTAEGTLPDGFGDNYVLDTTTSAVSYTIVPRKVAVAWSGTGTRVYDGKPSAVTAGLDRMVSGDALPTVEVSGGTQKDAGTYTAQAAVTFAEGTEDNYSLDEATTTTTYTITPKPVTLTWSGTGAREYNGQASAVSASVSGLAAGDTCNVTVSGDNGVNAGTYKATAAISNPNYTISGQVSVEYTILKAQQTVTVAAAELAGTAGGKVTITASTDRGGTLSYTSSAATIASVDAGGVVSLLAPGEAVITVTAAELQNYKGASAQVRIVISPKKVSQKKPKSTSQGKVTLKWAKTKGASGYQIQYSLTKKFKKSAKKTKTVTVKKGSKVKYVLKKLKSGKTYYVRIRAYKTIDGKKKYGPYSKVMKIKVK